MNNGQKNALIRVMQAGIENVGRAVNFDIQSLKLLLQLTFIKNDVEFTRECESYFKKYEAEAEAAQDLTITLNHLRRIVVRGNAAYGLNNLGPLAAEEVENCYTRTIESITSDLSLEALQEAFQEKAGSEALNASLASTMDAVERSAGDRKKIADAVEQATADRKRIADLERIISTPSTATRIYNGVKYMANEVWDGVWEDTIKGTTILVYNTIRHPVITAGQVKNGVQQFASHPIQTTKNVIWGTAQHAYNHPFRFTAGFVSSMAGQTLAFRFLKGRFVTASNVTSPSPLIASSEFGKPILEHSLESAYTTSVTALETSSNNILKLKSGPVFASPMLELESAMVSANAMATGIPAAEIASTSIINNTVIAPLTVSTSLNIKAKIEEENKVKKEIPPQKETSPLQRKTPQFDAWLKKTLRTSIDLVDSNNRKSLQTTHPSQSAHVVEQFSTVEYEQRVIKGKRVLF
jgi:hypothetical protein